MTDDNDGGKIADLKLERAIRSGNAVEVDAKTAFWATIDEMQSEARMLNFYMMLAGSNPLQTPVMSRTAATEKLSEEADFFQKNARQLLRLAERMEFQGEAS